MTQAASIESKRNEPKFSHTVQNSPRSEFEEKPRILPKIKLAEKVGAALHQKVILMQYPALNEPCSFGEGLVGKMGEALKQKMVLIAYPTLNE